MQKITIDFSEAKNALLKKSRGVCFEDVLTAIVENRVIDDLEHPNKAKYAHQRILIVQIGDYIYAVPYVKKGTTTIFLKTVFASRAYTKRYLI